MGLSQIQFFGEESVGFPGGGGHHPLLQGRPHAVGGGIHHEGQFGVLSALYSLAFFQIFLKGK